MNYAYVFVDNLNGHSYENGLSEIKASISTFKKIQKYNTIQVFNNEIDGKNIDFFKKENIIHNLISLSRNYGGSNNVNPINILVEKIIQLMNFDENKDLVLMDIDTSIEKQIPNDFFDNNHIVFDAMEYPIMQWRNLDKVLPKIPWKQFDINFDDSFLMYNTGVIYIPKKIRKELCEKALKIVDYLNDNFHPEERCGNKLDEQIALSIVCHDAYGRFGHIKYSSDYIHHHWQDRQNKIEWWKNYNFDKFDSFYNLHYSNCLHQVQELKQLLEDKVIIDIGSNIGLFSKSVAETVNYKHLHLFEPCYEYFEQSKITLKNFSNITYNNFGIGNNNVQATLYKDEINIGCNTLYTKDPIQSEGFTNYMKSEDVNIVKLDDYYDNIEQVDFIKIDVEGYEREVLEGSWNIIKKFKPYLLIEVAWGVNHPDWNLNKKTYEKLFSLGYEKIDLDSITSTCDLLFKPIKKSKATLVTGLWDGGRGNLNGIWNRPFSFYLERFIELLKTDNNLIVFGDEELKKIVFEYRDEHNTQFILKDLSYFRNNEYYPLIQKIRNDPKWKYQNDWIKDCPLGAMEMAIPIYLSKMMLLREAIEKSKFDSDYFYHVDGGTRMDRNSFSRETVDKLTDYSKFFFICFPYVGKEIHGFDYEKVKELTSESVENIDMVPRGTFFGGHKDNVNTLYPLYYDLMMNTLKEGFMGLDESIFTILLYNHPELIDYFRLSETDNGDPEIFFHKFKESQNKSSLFQKIKSNKKDKNYNISKLPISIGILSWKSNKTLRNTLNSYKKNGLFDIVDNVMLFFQEISDEDRKLAKEYDIPFISSEDNIGIGNAFIKLVEASKEENILLLEHDWELTENIEKTFLELKKGVEILNSGYNCVRYRSIENPGYPLYVQNAYQGNELNHYDPTMDLVSPHLFECRHWIKNINEIFPDKIQKENDYFITTSRWSNFTNNPCMYKKSFYLETVFPFKEIREKSLEYQKNFENNLNHYGGVEYWKHSLESDIAYWWSRQNFKIAWKNGLFTHNDIQKYETNNNFTDEKTISFIFANRKTDEWSTPISIVNEFKKLGWKTEIYSLFDSNGNYTDDNLKKILNTNPDIIMHMDWGQHTSSILAELRKTGAYCIMESGDDPQRFYNNSIKAPWFDLILSPDIRCVDEYRKNGYNAEWWTHFTDTNVYFPLECEPSCIAVCSRGMGNDAFIIDNLCQKYPNQIKNQNGWHGSEHNDFLNSGRIVLQQSRYGEITRRIFEGMSCKKLVLADRLDYSTKIQELFVDGEDIVFYDNEEDCLNKIVYYSNNQEEAKRIAENGYKKVLENHTQKQRVDFIIQKWKSVVK